MQNKSPIARARSKIDVILAKYRLFLGLFIFLVQGYFYLLTTKNHKYSQLSTGVTFPKITNFYV